MTLSEFKALLLTADANATHYKGAGTGNYTVWQEYDQTYSHADDRIAHSTVRVQVDRYTKTEYDPMVAAITQALDAGGVTVMGPRTLFEPDTGYIHHIWDLELPD